jgi:hypothetical protein
MPTDRDRRRIAAIAIFSIAILSILLLTSPAPAQSPDPIAAEMNRHSEAMARLLATETVRVTATNNLAAGGSTTSFPAGTVSDAPAVRVVSSTCNCALTGRCTCDPALCRCASCQTGQMNTARASASIPRAFQVQQVQQVQNFATVTTTNYVDRRGRVRQRIEYPRGMSRSQARALSASSQ